MRIARSVDACSRLSQGSLTLALLLCLGGCAQEQNLFLYVSGFREPSDASTISAYRIDPLSGVLTLVLGSPFESGGTLASRLLAHPSGRFLYLANRGTSLRGFGVDGATGALAPIPATPLTLADGTPLAIDGAGRFLYLDSSRTLSAYALAAGSGAPSLVATTQTPAYSIQSLALVPSGFAYVGTYDRAPHLPVYSVDLRTGGLAELSESPIRTEACPYQLLTVHSGRYLVVSNTIGWPNPQGGFVSVQRIDPRTGGVALVANPFTPTGGAAYGRTSARDRFVYFTGYPVLGLRATVWGFDIDPSTGAATPVPGLPLRLSDEKPDEGYSLSWDVKADPDGRFLCVSYISYTYRYTAGRVERYSYVAAFAIDGATGALRPVPGSPFLIPDVAVNLAIAAPRPSKRTI